MQTRTLMWAGVALVGLSAACSSNASFSLGASTDAALADAATNTPDTAPIVADSGSTATMDAFAPPDAAVDGDPNLEWAREARVRELVNAARVSGATCGTTAYPPVAPVAFNALLAQAARAHSADMCARQYFDHNDPDGKTPFDRIRATGYKYSTAGENIAAGQPTPEAVMAGWMNSEGHCQNIMNAAYEELGAGYAECTDQYVHYWTQNFGTKQ